MKPTSNTTVVIKLELTAEQAAGLARFAEKTGFEDAMAVLYPHVTRDIRAEQTHTILVALGILEKALSDARVRAWPWLETGHC